MGCGQSRVGDTNPETPAKVESPRIENEMRRASAASLANIPVAEEDITEDYSIIRILILGAAESGKTTLLEQIRLKYNQNYTEAELFHRKAFIYNMILKTIRTLILRVKETTGNFENEENNALAEQILAEEEQQYCRFHADMVEWISSVWKDPVVQDVYNLRSHMNLNDSAKYFLENIQHMNQLEWTPSPVDLIMSYVPTVGVHNVVFSAEDRILQVFDMGGQKIDRRKWASMYDGIDAILFCIAISEYDQTLTEDETTNRLEDSLLLLSKIASESKFSAVPLYVFMNEVDVFTEKLEFIPLQQHQPQYTGESVDAALDFVEALVTKAVAEHRLELTTLLRVTCIDSELMAHVLSNVFHDILEVNNNV